MAGFSFHFLRSITSGAVGLLHRIVSLNGIKYGSLGEVQGAPGISSSSPRTERTETLLGQATAWRGLSGTAPQLSKAGSVSSSPDQGQEFDFEWSPPGNTEDIIGSLAQNDVTYALVSEDEPTTAGHGCIIDAFCASRNVGGDCLNQHILAPAAFMGQTWYASAYFAPIDPTDTQDREVYLALGDGASVEGSFVYRTYTGRGKYQRISISFAFTSAAYTAGQTSLNVNTIRIQAGTRRYKVTRMGTVACGATGPTGLVVGVRESPDGPNGHEWERTTETKLRVGVGSYDPTLQSPMLICAVQVEQTSLTTYERTACDSGVDGVGASYGTRNRIIGSHFPTRTTAGVPVSFQYPPLYPTAEWSGVMGSKMPYSFIHDAGRGPEVRAIVPSPGSMEFGLAKSGVSAPNGIVKFKPKDVYGLGAFRVITSATGVSGVKATVTSNPQFKTIIFSAWVRNSGTNIPSDVSLSITPAGYGASTQSFGAPSRWWRRIWMTKYCANSSVSVEFYAFTADTTASRQLEWFGFQVEYVTAAQRPQSYIRTSGTVGAANKLTYSELLTNGYWIKVNCSITGSIAAPIEYFDPLHEALPNLSGPIRCNPGIEATQPWLSSPTVIKESLQGDIYSIGSNGSEVLGSAGNLSWNYDRIVNGSFESVLTYGWTTVVTGGTISIRSYLIDPTSEGKSSLRMTRSTVNSNGLNVNQSPTGFLASKWYLLSAQVRARVAGVITAAIYVKNNRSSVWCTSAGNAWSGTSQPCSSIVATTEYQQMSLWVLMESGGACLTTDPMNVMVSYYNSAIGSLSIDEVSFDGPYNTASLTDPHLPGWTEGTEHVTLGSCESLKWDSASPMWYQGSYSVGNRVSTTAGRRYVCASQTGPSGSTEPTSESSPVTDGGVTWTYQGKVTNAGSPNGGAYCLAYTHVSGVPINVEQSDFKFVPDKWYQLSVAVKGSVAKTAGLKVRVICGVGGAARELSGATWGAVGPSIPAINGNVTISWFTHTLWFKTEADKTFDSFYVIAVNSHTIWGGAEIMYVDDVSVKGPYNTASTSDPATPFTKATGSNAWADDEDASGDVAGVTTPALGSAQVKPTSWISNTTALVLTKNWYTVRVRVARMTTTTQIQMAVQIAAGGFYLDADQIGFTSYQRVWLASHSRETGTNIPDFGIAVWHLYLSAASGSYTFSFGGLTTSSSGGKVLHFDSIRIWSDAGMLYPSSDRRECEGDPGFSMQGFNVLFRGVIDEGVQADDVSIKIRCRDYVHGTAQLVPGWVTTPRCQVKFRGSECGYADSGSFQAASDVSGLIHNVTTTTYDTIEAGQFILAKDGDSYTQILTLLGASGVPSQYQFTTDTPQAYTTSDKLVYVNCNKVYADCSRRNRTHRYSGFRATLQPQIYSQEFLFSLYPSRGRQEQGGDGDIQFSASRLSRGINARDQQMIGEKRVFDDTAVPVVYGRKYVKTIPIEYHWVKHATDYRLDTAVTFHIIGIGEIDHVLQFYDRNGPLTFYFTSRYDGDRDMTAWPYWLWYYPGLRGEDSWRVIGGAIRDLVDPLDTHKMIAQPRDGLSNTGTAYNRVAYALTHRLRTNMNPDMATVPGIDVPELWADLQGRKVQIYDHFGSPVGGPVWSRNPIWIAIDLITDRLIGPSFPMSLIDWPTAVDSANECDESILNVDAVTSVRETPSFPTEAQTVVGISGFTRGMTVTFANKTTRVVYRTSTLLFLDPIGFRFFLDGAAFTPTIGDIVQGWNARYSCDLSLTSRYTAATALDMVLSSCRGYIAFRGGLIRLKIEHSAYDAPARTWDIKSPTPYNTKLGVIPRKLSYDQRRGSQNYNVLEVTYDNGQFFAAPPQVVRFVDADRGGNDFPRVLKIESAGSTNSDQALRTALPTFAKMCSALGGNDSMQDVRGMTVESGIGLLPVQLGEFITVARSGRTGTSMMRVNSITINENLNTSVRTMPEVRSLRAEGFSKPIDPYSDAPYGKNEFGSRLALPTIEFFVTKSSNSRLEGEVRVTGSSAAPGGSAYQTLQAFSRFELHVSTTTGFVPIPLGISDGGSLVARGSASSPFLVWDAVSSMIEVPIFAVVVAIGAGVDYTSTMSHEVQTSIYAAGADDVDGTYNEGNAPGNMVYDSDFTSGLSTPETLNVASDEAVKRGLGWLTNNAASTSIIRPIAGTGGYVTKWPDARLVYNLDPTHPVDSDPFYTAFTLPANGSDSNPATYAEGRGWYDNTPGLLYPLRTSSIIYNFAATAPMTGRFQVIGRYTGTPTYAGQPNIYKYYRDSTGDTSEPTFPYIRIDPYHIYSAVDTTAESNRISGRNLADHGVAIYVDWSSVGSGITFFCQSVQFQSETVLASTIAAINNNRLDLKGRGGGGYARAQRCFPGKQPEPQGIYFAAYSSNRWQISAKWLSGIQPTSPLQVLINDKISQVSWLVAEIAAGDIEQVWCGFTGIFIPTTPVSGNLDITIRTQDINGIQCDQLFLGRETAISQYQTSSEDKQIGHFPDVSIGVAKNWPLGALSPSIPYRKVRLTQ